MNIRPENSWRKGEERKEKRKLDKKESEDKKGFKKVLC